MCKQYRLGDFGCHGATSQQLFVTEPYYYTCVTTTSYPNYVFVKPHNHPSFFGSSLNNAPFTYTPLDIYHKRLIYVT